MFKNIFKTWSPLPSVCYNLVSVETSLRFYLNGVRVGVIRQNLQKLAELMKLTNLLEPKCTGKNFLVCVFLYSVRLTHF